MFSFKLDANGCIYLSKNFAEHSTPWAPCSYRPNSHCLYAPNTGTEFLITERHQSSAVRGDGCGRALCMSGVYRSLQRSDTPCPLLPYEYLLFASAFRFLGGGRGGSCPSAPAVQTQLKQQCVQGESFKFNAGINHWLPSGRWFENWWQRMMIWSQEIAKGSETLCLR